MHPTAVDLWLSRGYYVSQMFIVVIAAWAAIAAFRQYRAFKLFEILKFIEAERFREARRDVIRKIETRASEKWWEAEDAEQLEAAASTVCAFYDVIGRLMEYDGDVGRFRGVWSFFREHWAASIVRTHDALAGFLEYRRGTVANAYLGFTRLADAARPHVPMTGVRTPH